MKTSNRASLLLTPLLFAMALPAAASTILYDSSFGGSSLGDSNNIANGSTVSSLTGNTFKLVPGAPALSLGTISFGLAITSQAYTGGTFTLSIYEFSGSDPADNQSPVYTQDFTAALQTNTTSMFPVTLDTPYQIKANQKFGIALNHSATDQGSLLKWVKADSRQFGNMLALQQDDSFSSIDNGATFSSQYSETGNLVSLSEVSAVPEASTSLGLLALGAGGILTRRRSKRVA